MFQRKRIIPLSTRSIGHTRMAPVAGVGRHGRPLQSMISSHELQQSLQQRQQLLTKKPVRMPVDPRIKRHGGKTTQLDKGLKTVRARFAVDSTRRATEYGRSYVSFDKHLRGRSGKPDHPRKGKTVQCDRIGITAVHAASCCPLALGARASRPLFHSSDAGGTPAVPLYFATGDLPTKDSNGL
jgi:hypothetical protein